ncbi:MAG: hypothetical protein COZ06_09005 [Armatimonadetes bacterium CG_4_10_14_3_um_filter_66_18]|nr:NYN domain-containing protein [Armatimonadota bacterium]OIO96120.1 MAG: hypothetical protein AUJ96_25430 [Armatimonadetes bacterium CG2_30_66_41]PIU95871.1 MAG: hypothetical protein COS65_00200 [Armatimonadetes bacterium CG06_land_8_20_14_3_00_66_21]PIX49923.1 MAG: hypothetical protein COZ57_01530 [Armatimonadetes bacterium CG_4_8_14_3_um_filter_66_20]PIY50498.1 MAG: hypothetical protein COZ06_09005 [Armatimonadetes bacterium CG_4_10_14_3_um_filter_66_18]PIZ41052.1 MAG: hypothetical protein
MSQNAWLVDMGFVVKAATDGRRFKLDYLAARSFLVDRLGPTDAYLFNSIDPSFGVPAGLEAFYAAVERQGFRVRLIEMTGDRAAGTHRQQGVDEALIDQFTACADTPDSESLVLTSGDAHFVRVVEDVRHASGTRVILFGYDVNVSAQLKAAVDEFWPFEAHESLLARAERRGTRGRVSVGRTGW